MNTPTWREELSWCAGFFDGEGHVGVSKKRPHDIHLSISQVDRRVLDRFHRNVQCGAVSGPYSPPTVIRRKEQPRFYFQTGRFEYVQAITAMMWPFLDVVKRAQARIALLKARDVPVGKRLAKYWNVCKRGHARTPENIEVYQFKGYTCRRCLPCLRESRKLRWHRNAAQRRLARAMLTA